MLEKEILQKTHDLKQIEPLLFYMNESDVDALIRSLLS